MLISLFVVASQHDNKVSADQKWLKAKLLTKSVIPLQKFIDTGWIEPLEQVDSKPLADSAALADCKPSRAGGETETEIQTGGAPRSSGPEDPYSPDFEIFWTAYPRKTGKGKAFEAWRKLKPSRVLQDKILQAVGKARQSYDWTKENGRYIPYPTTWIHERRWDDTVSSNGADSDSHHGYL